MSLLIKQKPIAQTNLEIAFNNLLNSLDLEELTQPLDTALEWGAIEAHNADVQLLQHGEAGTWPSTNNAIIRFQQYPYHYAKVHNFQEHEILDVDGVVKKAYIYGVPQGWASYGYIHETDTGLANPDKFYTLGEGDTIWRIARDSSMLFGHKYTAEELAIHNGIEPTTVEMAKIQEGRTLHLPSAKQIKREPEIIYQFFEEPKIMHVNAKHGATKWSFGDVQRWEDIRKSGPTYKNGRVFKIVGVAQVPVKGEKLPLGYYIDSVSAGDNYHTTNRPKYTTGFRWKHDLKAGLPSNPYPPSEQPVQDPPKPQPEPVEPPNQYKTSYVAFEEGAVRHVFTRRVVVAEMDGRSAPKERNVGAKVDIAGTFMKDSKLYGRPFQCIASGLWYGVPMNSVVEENFEVDDDSIYATTEEMQTKKLVFKDGRFSLEERVVTIPLSKLGRQRKTLIDVITNIKEKI